MKQRRLKPAKVSNQAGYTMLELVVVGLIVIILAAILIWKNT